MAASGKGGWSARTTLRVLWAVFSAFVVESVVFGFSVLPAAIFWEWHLRWSLPYHWMETVLLSMAFIPAYLLFAFCLMLFSALAMYVTGWRAPDGAEMDIHDPDWPLLNWVRYMISIHLVRTFAGAIFRTSPLWTMYMRWNGARMGRGVFVNSLWVTDHNLLEFGDHVIIGSEVHLSGHTVEKGVVKTARVRLGDHVTAGVSNIISIGVEAGPGCQIGALSLVPKYARLEAGGTYVGIPVHLIQKRPVPTSANIEPTMGGVARNPPAIRYPRSASANPHPDAAPRRRPRPFGAVGARGAVHGLAPAQCHRQNPQGVRAYLPHQPRFQSARPHRPLARKHERVKPTDNARGGYHGKSHQDV